MKTTENKERKIKIISTNRKARHDFEITSKIEAGISLVGTEVKSLRSGKVNLQDSYAGFRAATDMELYLYNLQIPKYDFGNIMNHEPRRLRKLLITKREAKKLRSQTAEKGMTLIPLSIYFSGPYIKLEIGVCRAKKKYDKREALKERESKRDIEKKMKIR